MINRRELLIGAAASPLLFYSVGEAQLVEHQRFGVADPVKGYDLNVNISVPKSKDHL